MQFTTNKRIIDQYFGTTCSLYCTYDIGANLIRDYLYQKKLTKPSNVIKRIRLLYLPMEYHTNGSCYYKQMAIVLSINQPRILKRRGDYVSRVLPPQAVTKILNKRRYVFNSRHKNKTIVYYKRYEEENIWLKKHKLM